MNGVGNRKNAAFRSLLAERGVTPYQGSLSYLPRRTGGGFGHRRGHVVRKRAAILEAAHLDQFVQARIDGQVIAAQHLRGKPEPDSFLAGAEALGVEPPAAAVFEDALAGVEAGHAGGFGLVVGVDRTPHGFRGSSPEQTQHADALREHGADIVVSDLAELVGSP